MLEIQILMCLFLTFLIHIILAYLPSKPVWCTESSVKLNKYKIFKKNIVYLINSHQTVTTDHDLCNTFVDRQFGILRNHCQISYFCYRKSQTRQFKVVNNIMNHGVKFPRFLILFMQWNVVINFCLMLSRNFNEYIKLKAILLFYINSEIHLYMLNNFGSFI